MFVLFSEAHQRRTWVNVKHELLSVPSLSAEYPKDIVILELGGLHTEKFSSTRSSGLLC